MDTDHARTGLYNRLCAHLLAGAHGFRAREL